MENAIIYATVETPQRLQYIHNKLKKCGHFKIIFIYGLELHFNMIYSQ